MSTTGNKNKDALLGMSHGSACGQLRKKIIFSLAGRCGLLGCYRCGKTIEKVDDLSIEHKSPWQVAENPVEAFFDLDNISFSHLRCNASAARHLNRISNPAGKQWCRYCKEFKPLSDFSPNKIERRGPCKSCHQSQMEKIRSRD